MFRLARAGSVAVDEEIAPRASMWVGAGLPWAVPVRVKLTASLAGTGQIVVRGTMTGRLEQECRRCLEPATTEVDEKLTLVFAPTDDPQADDSDVHTYEPGANLDLSDAIREEAVLSRDPYVLCVPDCRGLCADCGANRNRGRCACKPRSNHPAWDTLKALMEK